MKQKSVIFFTAVCQAFNRFVLVCLGSYNKIPSPNTITLDIRISTYELEKNTNIEIIAQFFAHFRHPLIFMNEGWMNE